MHDRSASNDDANYNSTNSNSVDQSQINTKSHFEQILLRQSMTNTTMLDEKTQMQIKGANNMGPLTYSQKELLKLVELESKFKDIAKIKNLTNYHFEQHKVI